MHNVILSIRPKYVERIIASTKKYEFRKILFKQDVGRVYIYCTSPVKKIVGYFLVKEVIQGHPKTLWNKYKEKGGISRKEFFDYFSNYNTGYAIKIGKVVPFEREINPYEAIDYFIAPQNFLYVKEKTLLLEDS